MRTRPLAALLVAPLLAFGCGSPSGPPPLEPAAVTGVYDVAVLTFDPQGQVLGTEDILARLDERRLPELTLADTADATLAFMDPTTGNAELVEGDFETGAETVRVVFQDTMNTSGLVLLPSEITYEFDEDAGTLAFSGGSTADLARLTTLVPEFADHELPDPVQGTLTVIFTRRGSP